MHTPSLPTPRQASRRHGPAGAALFALLGLFAAACGGSDEPKGAPGSESQEVHLQPVAAAGRDPFTASSATAESAPVQPPLPNPTGQGIRTVNAATPGLYGGTQRLGSCDVEQQVRFLTADNAKARAFAQASDIEQATLPDYLRGLTPVVLRADIRVTNHGFRDGRADSFQSVLQAGTAVLVDDHGMPRVRCGCGNPLASPRAPKGSPVHKGDPWNGYQPNQVVVIEPTTHVINNLVIVNIADNTWIERKRGDDGAQDRAPQVVPPYDPANGIPNGPVTPPGAASADPCRRPDENGRDRSLPPTSPSAAPDGGPSAPGSGTTDCPTNPPASQSAPGENRLPSPGVPSDPATRPQQPQAEIPPDVPGELSDLPSDLPSDDLSDTPYDVPSDIPSDLTTQNPGDQEFPLDPDGSTVQPSDPHDPYADPYADPDLQPQPSDEGYPLESA
ncbi:DUF6777 domain-containing protein [Streptomyces sp. NPDC020858]|uniref:DUF6777 domain-containing protein n=1 Tax=Streptomyces sp. NPDC020858 TaxID=3365097 RepID=UPI0037969F9F